MRNLIKNNRPQITRWHRFENTTALELAACTEIIRIAAQAIKERQAFHLVLAGGTTPRRIYEALKSADTNWQAWHIYFGDERCLSVAHADRNSLMASIAWLDHVSIPASQIHPISAELGAVIAAEKYTEKLSRIDNFDLVLLGIGEDGHTASLFPQQDMGSQPDAPATLAVFNAPKPPPERVSLSANRLSKTHQLMYLVTGIGKKEAVQKWRNGEEIPASTITPQHGVDIYIESQLLD